MKKSIRAATTLATSVFGLLLFASPAFAGVGGSVVPDYPAVVTVGQSGVTASLTITNQSNSTNAANNVAATNISHTPSCGDSSNNPCTGADIDLGVFTVHNGVGRAGTACAGTAFTAGAPDSSGKVLFTAGAPVVLGPSSGPAAGSQCIIDFTVDVIKAPVNDASAAAGLQTEQLGFAQLQDLTTLGFGTGSGSNEVTVILITPSITTTPSAGGPVGTILNDTAVLTGGSNPTGNVTFNLYAPNDPTCSAAPVYTDTDPTAPYATSPGFVSNAAGVWHWSASYAGDANNTATSSPCVAEAVTIGKASPSISTTPSAGGPIGTILNDTAILSGGTNPTGSVTFKLFSPSDSACAGAAVYTDTDPSAPYATSPGFVSTVAGTYHWTADYAGDANNNATSSPCIAEPVTTGKASPSISTTPSAGGPVGTVLNDTAVLTGGSSPTGNVTFKLFAPSDATCSAAAVFTQVDGAAPYATGPGYTSLVAGIYHWTADYAGDANNNATSSPCAAEAVTTTGVTPTITTTLSAESVAVGSAVHDSATLTGETATAGGTVTYTVYTNNACTQGAIAAGTKSVTNGNVPNSDTVTFNTPGTFYWQAFYSGDSNNAAATSTCTSEVLTVGKFTPSITTLLSASSVSTSTPVHDSATLTGESSDAGGTVTYTVYTNSSCTTGAQSAGTKTVTNGVVPNSDAITFATPGTYYWQAVYSGDAKNAAATSSCREEVLTVTAPSPTGCEVDWKPVGAGWVDFGPVVFLNKDGRLLDSNNPCKLTLPLRFSPGSTKPTSSSVVASEATAIDIISALATGDTSEITNETTSAPTDESSSESDTRRGSSRSR